MRRRARGMVAVMLVAGLFPAAAAPLRPSAAPPHAAAPMYLEEPGDLLVGGSRFRRTVALRGFAAGNGHVVVAWEARSDGTGLAAGRRRAAPSEDGSVRVVVSFPLPLIQRPVGMVLRLRADATGGPGADASFSFTLYPEEVGRRIANRLGRARVALYDPAGRAAPTLAALGLEVRQFVEFEGLRDYGGDLIIVGPGGFTRGREALGPILANGARSGISILILEQPTLPGTLTGNLRLWPSFRRTPDTHVVFASDHPVFAGLAAARGVRYLAAATAQTRPLLPPTRGNFRVLAEVQVRSGRSSQEGVGLVEIPLGEGTILSAQASICADYASDPSARILFVNTLAYLLGEREEFGRVHLYASGPQHLPECLTHLAPRTSAAPEDLGGVDLLLAPGDWQAPRLRAGSGLPPLARVAAFLHAGGTLILLNPQPLVSDYLSRLIGETVYFEPGQPFRPEVIRTARSSRILQGIVRDDLQVLEDTSRSELRLRPGIRSGTIEPLLLIPGLVRYRVGRGTLVALALPDASECAATRASSLLARLFTNLGVPLESEQRAGPMEVTFLDR